MGRTEGGEGGRGGEGREGGREGGRPPLGTRIKGASSSLILLSTLPVQPMACSTTNDIPLCIKRIGEKLGVKGYIRQLVLVLYRAEQIQGPEREREDIKFCMLTL